MKFFLAFLIIFVLTTGCVTVQPPQKSNLTPGMVKTKIIKSRTTQTEIIRTFGAPNIVSKTRSGNEVWTYDKVSINTSWSEGFGTILIGELISVLLIGYPLLIVISNFVKSRKSRL